MNLNVIENRWTVSYVVELKERNPITDEYSGDKMPDFAGHLQGLNLPRQVFDNMTAYWREAVEMANAGLRVPLLNPDGREDRFYCLLIRRGHIVKGGFI